MSTSAPVAIVRVALTVAVSASGSHTNTAFGSQEWLRRLILRKTKLWNEPSAELKVNEFVQMTGSRSLSK